MVSMKKFQQQLNYLERLIVNQLAGATEALEANGKICRFAVSSTAVKRILPEHIPVLMYEAIRISKRVCDERRLPGFKKYVTVRQ